AAKGLLRVTHPQRIEAGDGLAAKREQAPRRACSLADRIEVGGNQEQAFAIPAPAEPEIFGSAKSPDLISLLVERDPEGPIFWRPGSRDIKRGGSSAYYTGKQQDCTKAESCNHPNPPGREFSVAEKASIVERAARVNFFPGKALGFRGPAGCSAVCRVIRTQ